MKISNIRKEYDRLSEIDFMFIYKGYTIMILSNGDQEVIDIPLAELERQLEEERFFRVHKSYIVNVTQIKEIGFDEKGMNVCINGHELPVSRRRKRALLKVLETRKNGSGSIFSSHL